jgi:hypothetical protein
MSTIEEPHKVGNGGSFVCGFHASGFEGVDDLLAASTGPSTTPRPLSRTTAELLAKLGVTTSAVGGRIADDVLESVAVDFDAMRAAGAV